MKHLEISTKDRLGFLSAITSGVISHDELSDKLLRCLAKTLSEQNSSETTLTESIAYSHSPHKMIEFLRLFSLDDDFKWYTHKWDMSIPFDIIQQKERQNITKSILSEMAYPKVSGPAININTYNQVWNFINFLNISEKVYTWTNTKFEYIRYGWHSIVDLSKRNPSTPVESLKLSDGHQFRDYIRMFKAAIEFRTDLNDDDRFSESIWKFITSSLPKDFEIVFNPAFDEVGYDINVYCDVVGLLSALNTICSWITKHKAISSKVIVDFISSVDSYTLEIFHIGSYFNNIEKLRQPTGDLANLRKRLFSVCDFTMEGDFNKDGQPCGAIIANVLDNTTILSDSRFNNCTISNLDTQIGGVKYKLRIYRG